MLLCMEIHIEMRYVRIGYWEYPIPADLMIMYINGCPFAHFSEAYPLFYDETIMDDYSICVEKMPLECPPYLEKYIPAHFLGDERWPVHSHVSH